MGNQLGCQDKEVDENFDRNNYKVFTFGKYRGGEGTI